MDDSGFDPIAKNKPHMKPKIQNPKQPQPTQQSQQQRKPELPKVSDPHEFFERYNSERKKQSDMASLPEYLLRYLEVENRLTSGMLSKADMHQVIVILVNLAHQGMAAEDFNAAAKILSKLEATCDIIVSHGDEIDPKIVMYILHNSAVCFQRLGEFHDCTAYLDACLYNVEKYPSQKSNHNANHDENAYQASEQIDFEQAKRTEYSVNVQLKLAYILSKNANKHNESYKVLKSSIECIHRNFDQLLIMAKSIEIPACHSTDVCLFSPERNKTMIIESNLERKIENLKQIICTLESLQPFLNEKSELIVGKVLPRSHLTQSLASDLANTQSSRLRSALGVSLRRPWMLELNIDDMFRLDFIYTDEFLLVSDPGHYVSVDAVLEKIMILAVIYYMASSELRIINTEDKDSREIGQNKHDTYILHKKAHDICRLYLPNDCPVVQKILNSYDNFYSSMETDKKGLFFENRLKRSLSKRKTLAQKTNLEIFKNTKSRNLLSPRADEETIAVKRIYNDSKRSLNDLDYAFNLNSIDNKSISNNKAGLRKSSSQLNIRYTDQNGSRKQFYNDKVPTNKFKLNAISKNEKTKERGLKDLPDLSKLNRMVYKKYISKNSLQ